MAKYRIKVEALDPKEELRAEYRMGIECEGYAILADTEVGSDLALQDISIFDLAEMMAKHEELAKSACIARGIIEAASVSRDFSAKKAMAKLLAMDDDDD